MGAERIRVGVADMAVTDADRPLVTSGLGSCVAVAIHDGDGVAGLLHAMLPEAPDDTTAPAAKYVDAGVEALLSELTGLGADRRALSAKLTGGSSMLDLGGDPVGDQNVTAARETLSAFDVELVGEDTGGSSGRSVSFHPTTGALTIERVNTEETVL